MLTVDDKKILEEVADLHEIPMGAHSIRKNGEGYSIKSTENIIITKKEEVEGIDILVKSTTQNESVHIPVIVSENGLDDVVYNTFTIEEGADVTIIAGCGVKCLGKEVSQHDGVHEFFIGKNSKMKYIEKHYGTGDEEAGKVLNPVTIIHGSENSHIDLELVQIGGVTDTNRDTKIELEKGAKLIVTERLLTEQKQQAKSDIVVELKGENSSAQIISRSVAKDNSLQDFTFDLKGYAKSKGHIECDAIIMGDAKVISVPALGAFSEDANLIHEAAIGKIESEQITKLMTLGLTSEEAEEEILRGFLR
jgi:Fe-S cluster assembly scaffold protein SufB